MASSPMQTGCLHAVGSSVYVFFLFLRAGEVVVPSASNYDPAVHLSHGDVRAENTASPRYLEIRIKASKTDPFRKGVSIYVGRGSCDLCPVAAVLNYMVQRGSAPGPLFPFREWKLPNKGTICNCNENGLGCSRHQPLTLCGA